MLRISDIRLNLDHTEEDLKNSILTRLQIPADNLVNFQIARRSVDARKHSRVYLVYTIDTEIKTENQIAEKFDDPKIAKYLPHGYELPTTAPKTLKHRPIIIGTGPSGLFAGLLLSEMGFCPILLERGKKVNDRVRDVYGFWKTASLDPESNVAFGEGGAGTFSDGKLTTQIKDKAHRCDKILTEFVEAGAPEDILYAAKPHIGTDKLVGVVANIRRKIEKLGGEIHFETRVTDLITEKNTIQGVKLADGRQIETDTVILAIGHSARDTFQMLRDRGTAMQQKAFSIGVRIEHKQSMIDRAQYGKFAGHPKLGAADYKLVHHCQNARSVYSFCMCPGGEVIAAASELDCIVTNGMSRYSRNAENANSAILVGVKPDDFDGDDVLAGVEFQRKWEKKAFELAGSSYNAPAQLVGDFLRKKASTKSGQITPSYKPGVQFTDITHCLPPYVCHAMAEALAEFDKKLKGFATYDAVMTGVETRSSSPVRILRGENYQSLNTTGLYPAGEGAGYAGGIVSAAVDGIKAAEAAAIKLAATSQ